MKKRLAGKAESFLLIVSLLYLQQLQLSYSATIGIKSNLTMQFSWIMINILIVAIPFCIILVITRRIDISIIVNAVVITILSLMNDHALSFHGSPFLAGDIFSITTAINVISEYYIVFDTIIFRLIAVFLFEMTIWFTIVGQLSAIRME